jgi:hypothetical protein
MAASNRCRLAVSTALALAVICFGFTPRSGMAAPAAAVPSLRFVSAAGFPLAIAGRGWVGASRVVFSVQEIAVAAGLQVRITRKGTFLVGLTGVSLCDRPVFLARDFSTRQAKLTGPPLGCASRANPPVPQLQLLKGKLARHQIVRIYGVQPHSVTVHVGAEVYVWESGATRPAFVPKADPTFLWLLGEGTTPPRACPQVGCDAGFYWDYVALQAGKTLIDMSPWCREAQPPCEMPDFAIAVKILS